MHIDDFAGTGLPPRALDQAAAAAIAKTDFKKEPALFESKWFDYRSLHPVHATELFAECYREAYRRIAAERIDYIDGLKNSGIKPGGLFDLTKTQATGLWRARQSADSLGCRYDFYTLTALRWCEDRHWDRVPRPNQLYSEALVEHVSFRWRLYSAQCLQLAQDGRFTQLTPDRLDSQQRAYVDYLVAQVHDRVHPELAVHSLVTRYSTFTPELARQEFGSELFERAMRI
tara:strand:+ start:3166 stop:3855 length:690 start_codon:yes stop_codon:yes gene_type:complete